MSWWDELRAVVELLGLLLAIAIPGALLHALVDRVLAANPLRDATRTDGRRR